MPIEIDGVQMYTKDELDNLAITMANSVKETRDSIPIELAASVKEYDQDGIELETTGELKIIRLTSGLETVILTTSTGTEIPLS